MPFQSNYAGGRVAFLTQHGKERVVAPVLEPNLDCVIDVVTSFDTDQFGTFTRERPRTCTQLEAARRKARKGMELTGLPIGLSSEGSFGPDPFTGMFTWNVELVVWIDDIHDIEVVGIAEGAAFSGHLQTGNWSDVEAFAERSDFPQQQLVMRPSWAEDLRVHKGISDWAQLKTRFKECLAQSHNGKVFVETDLRAFANPNRLHIIEKAAVNLLQRIRSHCPECEAPGFWPTERQAGLPCAACGLPTSVYQSKIWECMKCKYLKREIRRDCLMAEPKHCSYCNP